LAAASVVVLAEARAGASVEVALVALVVEASAVVVQAEVGNTELFPVLLVSVICFFIC
jgi:hypothetical protein